MSSHREGSSVDVKCGQCRSRPPEPGMKSCTKCREWYRQYRRAKYQDAIARNVCTRCRRPKEDPQFKMCGQCRDTHRTRPMTDERREWRKSYMADYMRKNDEILRPKRQAYSRNRAAVLRSEIITRYGSRCACCSESTPQFLSIDHVNNDGAAKRKYVRDGGHGKGMSFYRHIVDAGFPDTFQLLCHNCNFAKGVYGACPHSDLS